MADRATGAALPREVEAALVIRSETPAATARRVAGLRGADGLVFEPLPTQSIADRYVDTPEGGLAARRLALRVRELDGEPRLTLKGDAVPLEGASDRLELELPWSDGALERVFDELGRRGLPLDVPQAGGDPVGALAAAGLRVVQVRETRRDVRTVADARTGNALAELDLDAVTYRLEHGVARLHEVEIEARANRAELDRIAGTLREEAPDLQPWPYSKLATGKAIDRGLAAHTLRLGPEGLVTPSALDWLAERLAAEDR